jgi:hypothetical protein
LHGFLLLWFELIDENPYLSSAMASPPVLRELLRSCAKPPLGIFPKSSFTKTGLVSGKHYWFRAAAVGTEGQRRGVPASATVPASCQARFVPIACFGMAWAKNRRKRANSPIKPPNHPSMKTKSTQCKKILSRMISSPPPAKKSGLHDNQIDQKKNLWPPKL